MKRTSQRSLALRSNALLPRIEDLKLAAAGRWRDIVVDSGIDATLLDGRNHPCPRCGGRDRFAVFSDFLQRGSAHCRACFNSETVPRPGDGIATLQWSLDCDTSAAVRWVSDWLDPTESPLLTERRFVHCTVPLLHSSSHGSQLASFAESCYQAMRSAWWSRLEMILALPSAALERLRVGWSSEHNATTWPMVDSSQQVVGIRLRCMQTGRKWSVKGGRAGLFVPAELSNTLERLFIAEGPTDTAAMLAVGFDCIGRPSCNGAIAITTNLVNKLRPSECVIVADNDANRAGRRGAQSLAAALVTSCPRVRIISPPNSINDARDWVRNGGTAEDVIRLVHTAPIQSLTLGKDAE